MYVEDAQKNECVQKQQYFIERQSNNKCKTTVGDFA
jgi:hypothetical protein